MPDACPSCGAEFDPPLAAGAKCPECGARVPPARSRRDVDDDEPDAEPRRRRRPPPKKRSTAVTVLLVLGGVAALLVALCCGGVALFWAYGPKEVEVLDATRQTTPEGGTASVTVNLRIGANRPGNMVMADYVFMCKAGNRTTVHRVGLRGDGGSEYKTTIPTPELAREPGPVEFWVERDDRGGTSRVSKVRTIP